MSEQNENSNQPNNPPFSMPTAFDPHPVEARWQAFWQEQNLFAPDEANASTGRYCITIPPPNVTGVLHLGHALQHSIHDCLLRYHRMKGEATLCVPGTDHASIGTQVKVEQHLFATEGKTRHDLGREEFLRRSWEWKDKYGRTIIEQMKSLGCSYDWSRERFTMDEGYTRAVLTVFKEWFDKKLIYRGLRLVNWSPGAHSTVSDLEIEYREVDGHLWHFKYPVQGSDRFIVVATTRPETMLGDTGVAVHPNDERYADLIGKNVMLPLMNRAIPIIADHLVDKEFGTGAVKVTPAHDPNDYDMGTRHGLPMISVIGFDARMTEEAGVYAGLSREEARKAVVRDLKEQGFLEKIEPYSHSVGHCSRTGVVIEPLLSEQWFVDMKELARPVADALRMKRVQYTPERAGDTSLVWLDNIRDWCISRQLWWGHRIPVYYGPKGEVVCSLEPITEEDWTQDEDVLDTWFSSALWPFAVLGWPDNFEKEWYPTSVLITGRDILNLWVSRMILTSLDFVDDIPFHDVLIHPTVQDCFGLRMSKSLGTGIDPMALIETYGADATRFGLLQLAGGSQDVRFIDQAEVQLGEEIVRGLVKMQKPLPINWTGKPTERFPQMQSARNFANKIWNASRFVLSSQQSAISNQPDYPNNLLSRWILARLSSTRDVVTTALDNYQFDAAASALYNFIWGDFCDWFVELSKPKLRAGDAAHGALINFVLDETLRLLHPFMPFLSEEIWQQLPTNKEAPSLCIAVWPGKVEMPYFEAAERDFAIIQDTVRAARNLRAEAKLPPGQKLTMTLVALEENAAQVLRENVHYVTQLANLENASIVESDAPRPQNALSASLPGVEIFLPLEGLIDVPRERARLQKEIDEREGDLKRVEAKLSNPQFTEKAPPAVVQKEQAKRDENQAALAKLRERLAALD
jgi:valyl-tRNA synthetase